MAFETVHLDLAGLTPEQQVARLKEQYVLLRGRNAVVRARADALPVRQYISLLERGYRVTLERERESFTLVLRPDGSAESSICLIDARQHQTRARLQVGAAPAHLAFSPDTECAFVACESTDEVAVIGLRKQTVVGLIKAGRCVQ